VASEYKPREIIISENGASYSDTPDVNGAIHDNQRITYLNGHFRAMAQAIQAGVPLTGYYLWSFLDNFEWALGYTQHFGIVHVDFATQKRTPKASAHWYRQVIEQNGLPVSP
jgi:beta-glucosidase